MGNTLNIPCYNFEMTDEEKLEIFIRNEDCENIEYIIGKNKELLKKHICKVDMNNYNHDTKHLTPLGLACDIGSVKVVNLLLKLGLTVKSYINTYKHYSHKYIYLFPLDLAIISNQKIETKIEIINLLIKAGHPYDSKIIKKFREKIDITEYYLIKNILKDYKEKIIANLKKKYDITSNKIENTDQTKQTDLINLFD